MGTMAQQRKREGLYTYADYLTWPEDERWEIIDGVAYDMTPAPAPRHQRILAKLIYQLMGALGDNPCVLYPAPFDVRIPHSDDLQDETITSVVQPDISVICQKDKIDRRGCVGAPDLAVEILSPSTAYKDQTAKLNLYERSGVREYWVVNPERQSVQVYLLQGEGGFAKPVAYRSPEALPLVALEGIEVSLQEVFAE